MRWICCILQVGESAGPECKAVLQEITHLIDQRVEADAEEVKSLFGASQVWILFSTCPDMNDCDSNAFDESTSSQEVACIVYIW